MDGQAEEPAGPTGPSSSSPADTNRWWTVGKIAVLLLQGLAATATVLGVLVTNGCGPT